MLTDSLRASPLDSRLAFTVLAGPPEARGAELARLFGPEAARARAVFGSIVGRLIRMGLPVLPVRATEYIDRALYRVAGRAIASHFSPEVRRTIAALATTEKLDDLLRTHIGLDQLLLTIALTHRMGIGIPAAPAACSCVAAFGAATRGGRLYVGRNFDLPVYRPDAPPAWIVLERPARGIPHLSIYPLPGLSPGVTAINREGLIVSILMNFSKRVSRHAEPIVQLARTVIENARTIDEARQLLATHRPAAGWTFFVAESAQPGAACFEVSPSGLGEVAPDRGVLTAANRFRSTRLAGTDFAPSAGFREHNEAREARLLTATEILRGQLDAEQIASILGDTRDPTTGRDRAFGPAIAAADCTDSVVFAPEDNLLYVAAGGWPANAAGSYVGLDLAALFSGRLEIRGELAANRDGTRRASIQAYLEACYQLIVEGSDPAAERAIDRAIEADPHEPNFRLSRAALRLRRAHGSGAESDLRIALANETWPARRAFASLLLGHALDLRGARKDALTAYRAAREPLIDPTVARAAARASLRPFSRRRARFIGFDPLLATTA